MENFKVLSVKKPLNSFNFLPKPSLRPIRSQESLKPPSPLLPSITPNCPSQHKPHAHHKRSASKVISNLIKSKPQYKSQQPEKSAHNERLLLKKRLQLAPLLILNFEGVLGDYYKDNLWDNLHKEFVFRPGLASGLKMLKNEFNIALVVTLNKKRSLELLQLISTLKLPIDAVYRKRNKDFLPREFHDITTILQDFSTPRCKVICLCASSIDMQELTERSTEEIIYKTSGSIFQKYSTYYAPICEDTIPVTIIVPHYRLDQHRNFVNFSIYLLRFKSFNSDFFQVFRDVNIKKLSIKLSKSDPRLLRFIIYLPDPLPQNVQKISILLSKKLSTSPESKQ